jgi:DNA-binding NarL/FixJ family response regulator
MADPITVVLADDHAVVRTGLRFVLEAEADLKVVAEAGTVDDALRLTKAHRPSVLVLDFNMPGGPGTSPSRRRRRARARGRLRRPRRRPPARRGRPRRAGRAG